VTRRGRPSLAVLAAAAMLGLGPSPFAHAQQLPGRLFMTPAERAHLDALRAAQPMRVETQAHGDTPQAAIDIPPPPPPEPFTMNGLVVRSSGPNTAWVDGRPVHQTQDTGKGVSINTRTMDSSGAAVTVLESGRPVRLKPGQTYIPQGNQVSDRFEEAPPPPPPLPPGR